MSLEHKYAICDQAKVDSLDATKIQQIQDTFDYEVIIEPTLMPDGNYIVEYCGTKPYALYSTTALTSDEVKARRENPEDPWYVDPNADF